MQETSHFFISLNQFHSALESLSPGWWEIQSRSLLGFPFLLWESYDNLSLLKVLRTEEAPDPLSRLLLIFDSAPCISGSWCWEWDPGRDTLLYRFAQVFLPFHPSPCKHSVGNGEPCRRAIVTHCHGNTHPRSYCLTRQPSHWSETSPPLLRKHFLSSTPPSCSRMTQQNPPLMDSRKPLWGFLFFRMWQQKKMPALVGLLLYYRPVYTGAPGALSRAASSRGEDGKRGKETYPKGAFCIFLSLEYSTPSQFLILTRLLSSFCRPKVWVSLDSCAKPGLNPISSLPKGLL